jgi:hypothetical protein
MPNLWVVVSSAITTSVSSGELIYSWKKVRLKSWLESNLTFYPGSVNLDFLPGSNLTKYAGFTCKYYFTGIHT